MVGRGVCRETGVSTIISSSIGSGCSIRRHVGQCYGLNQIRSGWFVLNLLPHPSDLRMVWSWNHMKSWDMSSIQVLFLERMVPISRNWFPKNWKIPKINVEVEEHLSRVFKIHLHDHWKASLLPPRVARCLGQYPNKEVGRRPLLNHGIDV